MKSVTRVIARRAGLGECTSANAGRFKRRGSVARGVFGARFCVRSCLTVGSIRVIEGATRGNVASVHFRGNGVARVENECMKGWHVMLQLLSVGVLVIRC